MATPAFVSQYKGFLYKASDDTLLQTQFLLGVIDGANRQTLWNGNPSYNTGEQASPAAAVNTLYTHDAPWMEEGYGCITPRVSVVTQSTAMSGAFTGAIGMVGSLETIHDLGGIYIKLFPLDADRRIYIEPTTWTNPGVCRFRYVRAGVEHASVTVTMGNTCTIPWPEPLIDEGACLFAYTLQLQSSNGKGRVIRPGASTSNRNNWPFKIEATGGNTYNNLLGFFEGLQPIDPDDPYQDVTDSTPSGPAEGVGYPEDELVPIPSLPSVSVTDTGFVTLFNPSLAQVKALASYMWAGLFDVATFKKLFADPMDCILGFNMLPVAIPNGGSAEVVVGNISTGVSMTKAAGQWVELDCGSLAIDKPFGNYLDWSPYMKWSIYLPYIGTVDLSTDDIMGHTIHLVYHIDVLSCACVAYLEVDGRVMYQWTGSCGYSIPVTGENFRQMIANIVNIAANLGGAIATGGMTAPLAIASAASVTQNVMSSKPEVHRSGAIGSSAGMMGMQKPYLIQQGPKICKPEKQYHYLGYPAFVTVQLGNVSGYQEFSSVILDGIPCTEEERDMIAAACEGGIYL